MIDIENEKILTQKLQAEISSGKTQKSDNREFDADVLKKTETELQLNFLINQLMHYLTIIKKNNP